MFLFAGMMAVVMVIFIFLAMNYKYAKGQIDDKDERTETSNM